jgi:hypothetical protein
VKIIPLLPNLRCLRLDLPRVVNFCYVLHSASRFCLSLVVIHKKSPERWIPPGLVL